MKTYFESGGSTKTMAELKDQWGDDREHENNPNRCHCLSIGLHHRDRNHRLICDRCKKAIG